MKAHRLIPNTIAVTTYPPMFRAVTSAKRRKRLLLHNFYATSSKPASGNLSPKFSNSFGLKSVSGNFLPSIWKTLAAASSLLNNIVNFTKGKREDPSTVKTEDPSKLKTENLSKVKTEDLSKLESNNLSKLECNNLSNLKTGDLSKVNADEKVLNVKTNEKELITRTVHAQNFISDVTSPSFTKLSSDVKFENVPLNKNTNEDMEQTFFEWLSGSDMRTKRKELMVQDEKTVDKRKKTLISKSSLQQRSRFLVSSLCEASSSGSQLLRLEEVCKHLLLYPEQKIIMSKAGLVRIALSLKYDVSDKAIREQARCALALVGYHEPPKGEGIRILSIDGGGTRAIMAIEILRQLEAATNQKIHELFDYICGVSSGAVLSLLLGGLHLSLDECELLYRKLSDEIFQQSTFWGTGRLMWNHAYYDTTAWVNVLKKTFDEKLIIDTAKDKSSPKLAAFSAIMNLPHLEAFVFRNYDFAPRVQSYYKGSCRYRMWEGIRASGAAPGYFEEFCLDDYLHQDGGIMINNPTALAIHEARLLWPSDSIQCVLSIGCGRYIPPTMPNFTSTSLKTKVLKVIDSATDTESVHTALNDLLTPDTYFRVNPYLTEFLNLDENREEKLDQMKRDAQMYLRRNEYKISSAARTLLFRRSYLKRAKDWLRVQKDLVL